MSWISATEARALAEDNRPCNALVDEIMKCIVEQANSGSFSACYFLEGDNLYQKDRLLKLFSEMGYSCCMVGTDDASFYVRW